MNAETAKQVSLIAILDQLGAKRGKENEREIWYHSPFRVELEASFKVNKNANTYYDFGEGSGGNNLDFIMRYYDCNFKESLKIISKKFNPFYFPKPTIMKPAEEIKTTYKITSVRKVTSNALVDYMRNERQLSMSIVHKYCEEIHYKFNNGKTYFGVGFKNDLEGYAIRNKFMKICLGSQAMTTIANGGSSLMIFEGFCDFIAYLTIYPDAEQEYDFIILNSTSGVDRLLKSRTEELNKYDLILICLDNDSAGELATDKILKVYPKTAIDQRGRYVKYEDFNDFLIAIKRS